MFLRPQWMFVFVMLISVLAYVCAPDSSTRVSTVTTKSQPMAIHTATPATAIASEKLAIDRKIDLLLPAIRFKESTNGLNREGDKFDEWGRPLDPKYWSYGSLQIGRLCLADYNEAHKTAHTLQDVKCDDVLSEKIFRWYLKFWCTEKRLGRQPTLEDLARTWNGGPNGYKRRSTDEYWSDISGLLFGHENAYAVRR